MVLRVLFLRHSQVTANPKQSVLVPAQPNEKSSESASAMALFSVSAIGKSLRLRTVKVE